MLRESSKLEGSQANLEVITSGMKVNGKEGLNAEAALVAFAEAALTDDTVAIAAARDALSKVTSESAMIDAAAVIANFQRMVRVADASGIPLDTPIAMITADLRDNLGINSFGSADTTPTIGYGKRLLGRLMGKMIPLLFRNMSK